MRCKSRAVEFSASRPQFRSVEVTSRLRLLSALALLFCAGVFLRASDKGPTPGSAHWHYERALVFLLDEPKAAEIELEAAIAKDSNYSEAHFLLATRYKLRSRFDAAIQEFRKAIPSSTHDHLPARIGLAESLFRQGNFRLALNELAPVVKTLDQENFRLELGRLLNSLHQDTSEAGLKVSQGQIEELFVRIEDLLKGSPESYRKFTFDRDLNDAAVMMDLATLYEDADNPEDLKKFVREVMKRRDGFSPIALESYARLLKSQKEIAQAAEALEKAIDQLKQLGFREGKEIDTRELEALKKQLQHP